MLHEKELRIALVCFGGVSLAIYIHGITKELLKLARASSALHDIEDRRARAGAGFFDEQDESDPEYDSEAIYFELLRDLGPDLELRVIIDIVAGTSAGGINGTMLARALSHDLRIGRLRDLWLDNADVSELLAPDARAQSWSKWFLRPLIRAAGAGGNMLIRDDEIRDKLSLFMRSRWFKPPLDGVKMARLMYDAVLAMEPRGENSSLLPSGQALDLFVTLTDFFGIQHPMHIHDPPLIHERDHRHVLQFRYQRRADGNQDSDFELGNAPALAFAARATSSIPGIFPPSQLMEIDHLARNLADPWPRRSAFIAENFHHYQSTGIDIASVPFIDGGVVNNRPFREAIGAIRGRPSYRQVDRRVVYIDPNPAIMSVPPHHTVPGFFSTLRGALSEIPLAEPITDNLGWINQLNAQARRLQAVAEGARPQISGLVKDIIDHNGARINAQRIRRWRERANVRAARKAGFAFDAYIRLKLASVHDFLARLILDIRGIRPDTPFGRAVVEIIDVWALGAGVTYEPADINLLRSEAPKPGVATAKWIPFLLAFDIGYRRRRLHFLIEGQNRLYRNLDAAEIKGLDAAMIDRLKRSLYEQVEAIEARAAAAVSDPVSRDLVDKIFRETFSSGALRNLRSHATAVVADHHDHIDQLVAHLAAAVDLDVTTHNIDHLLADLQDWPLRGRQEVLTDYLGFPFWDVLTFPILPWQDNGEFNEIKVDRISARDARGINQLGSFSPKGTAFNKFAAFLSRSYRENDYLLGRLHAFDRLIDIVCDAAGTDAIKPDSVRRLKEQGLLRIIANEEPHLPTCSRLIKELRAALADGKLA